MLKHIVYIIAIFLLGCDTSNVCKGQCDAEATGTLLQKFENSLNAWNSIKGNDRYQYAVVTSSWTGFGSETVIHVSNDAVVKREYQSWGAEPDKIEQWMEDTNETLASHSDGAPLKTMKTLYSECQVILKERDNDDNTVSFSTDDNGVLKQCVYVPTNCADDCSFGVDIQNLQIKP